MVKKNKREKKKRKKARNLQISNNGKTKNHNRKGTLVAIKKIVHKTSKEIRKAFLQEVTLVNALQHRNIITIYGFVLNLLDVFGVVMTLFFISVIYISICVDEESLGIVMEYMPKSSLFELLHDDGDGKNKIT
jgi:serine/threonine protein kinase